MCDTGNINAQQGPAYNVPTNTIGIGNPVPPGDGTYGSGDKFGCFGKPATKKGSKTTEESPYQRPYIVYKK